LLLLLLLLATQRPATLLLLLCRTRCEGAHVCYDACTLAAVRLLVVHQALLLLAVWQRHRQLLLTLLTIQLLLLHAGRALTSLWQGFAAAISCCCCCWRCRGTLPWSIS
jgi:hypothetical protein